MSLWTAKDAAKATGGTAIGNWSVDGLSIDTRSINASDLFVPLKDARDGHDFIPMALEKGAAVISERALENVPALLVKDSLQSLRDLGKAACIRSGARRIAVTGSVGKTSVKEAIYAALSASVKTHRSIKSFNNHWGVPLTMAVMPKDSAFGVFETGMNHAGELSDLSRLLAPNIAVITKIAAVHLEHFENVDAIAAAKAEIFDGMAKGGVAVLPKDDDYFEYLNARAIAKGLSVIAVGREDVDPSLILQNAGEHHALNGAFALAVAMLCGVDMQKARRGLSEMPMLDGRGAAFEAIINGKSVTIIDDAYNANPTSMRAAIAAAGLRAERKIAVLGDMGELGPTGPKLHAELATPLSEAGFAKVITVGSLMENLKDALPSDMHGAHVSDKTGVMTALNGIAKPNDIILFKASNSVGLGTLITRLKGQAA